MKKYLILASLLMLLISCGSNERALLIAMEARLKTDSIEISHLKVSRDSLVKELTIINASQSMVVYRSFLDRYEIHLEYHRTFENKSGLLLRRFDRIEEAYKNHTVDSDVMNRVRRIEGALRSNDIRYVDGTNRRRDF